MLFKNEMSMLVEMSMVPKGPSGIPFICVDMQQIKYVPDPIIVRTIVRIGTIITVIDDFCYLFQDLSRTCQFYLCHYPVRHSLNV